MKLIRGDTFRREVRLESGRLQSAPIAGVDVSGASARLTVADHGLPNTWRVAVVGANLPGLTARNRPPKQDDFHVCSAIDANTLEIPNISPIGWPLYSGGAVLQYGAPLDLTGCTARMQFRTTPESDPVLAEWSTAGGELNIESGVVVIDVSADKTVLLPTGWLVTSLEVTYPGGLTKTYAPNLKVLVMEDATR